MQLARALALFLLCTVGAVAQADDVAQGKQIYLQQCLACHGVKGRGDGPAGRALNPKPTDFTTTVAKDAEWFKATKLGTKAIGKPSAMEGFAGKLTDAQIRDVLAYVKTLKAAP